MEIREFHQSKGRTTKPMVWKIWTKGNQVFVEHGQLGGQMQKTPGQTFEAVNVGKANEKSPKQVAEEWMARQILLRRRKGYVEVGATGKPLQEAQDTINWEMLPENMRLWKPNNTMPPHMRKVIEAGNAIWTRKRDGNQHTVMKDAHGHWQMYSSTMQPCHKDEEGEHMWLDRYPHIKAALERLNVPPMTMFSGELVTAFKQDDDGFDIDDLLYVSSIVKSKTELALEKQEKGGKLTYCIFDLIYRKGESYFSSVITIDRLMTVHALVREVNDPYLSHVEIFRGGVTPSSGLIYHANGEEEFEFDGSEKEALQIAKDHRWEGFVAHDPKGTFEDKGVNFAGKAQRPKFAVKVKPTLEADFCVRWDPDNGEGTWGKGKKSKGVGAVFAYLWDEALNGWRYITKVGGGLTDEQVTQFANKKLYPAVWKVEFASWTPEGSIQFPVFVEVRTDKKPKECTTEQMPAFSKGGGDEE